MINWINFDFQQKEHGFTLLETLVALAILSLTSLALFQSVGTMVAVSQKAAIASEKIADKTMSREVFKHVVGGLTPGWQEQQSKRFVGSENKLSGLSASLPMDQGVGLTEFYMLIEAAEIPRLTSLKLYTVENDMVLHQFNGDNFVFQYLGEDQQWYQNWPPEEIPSMGFFDDVKYMKAPALPLAVRIVQKTRDEGVVGPEPNWTAFVYSSSDLPFRENFTRER